MLDSPETPGSCWVHWSVLGMDGYRGLEPGQAVTVEWEAGEQDGYDYRALRVDV
ncbi:MAG: cold shock domain-containing protein [Kineosporiaceae bacterium]